MLSLIATSLVQSPVCVLKHIWIGLSAFTARPASLGLYLYQLLGSGDEVLQQLQRCAWEPLLSPTFAA